MRNPFILALLACAPIVAIGAACERYNPPPTPVIEGLEGSVLSDAKAPLVVSFGKDVEPDSLSVKVIYLETDQEGNLFDEDDDPDTNLRVLISRDKYESKGGTAELVDGNTKLKLVPTGAFPVGPKLALVFEAGLKSPDGKERLFRTIIPFSYTVKCTAGARADKFVSGTYFALLEVDKPIGTQIQILAHIEVNKDTGAFLGQFTNADRNPDKGRCSPACGADDACRTLPKMECIPPSTKAVTSDEYPDFVPNQTPPTGYSFTVEGCAVDDEKGTGVITAPATMVVQSPPVTVGGLVMTASWIPDANGNVKATGSLTAEAVSLNDNVIGPGIGTMTATLIPLDKVPPNVPAPPAKPDAGARPDAGK